MLNIIRKYSAFVVSGTFSVILAACYGSPMDMQNQKRIMVKNTENTPIEGIQLTLKQDNAAIDSVLTDANGDAYFNLPKATENNFEITVKDIDGIENKGEYSEKVLILNEEREIAVQLDRK